MVTDDGKQSRALPKDADLLFDFICHEACIDTLRPGMLRHTFGHD